MPRDLPRRVANITREISISAYRRHTDDADQAEELAKHWIRPKVGTNYLDDAEDLAGKLIRYWRRKKITEPTAVYQPGEPGFVPDGEL